MEQRQRGIKSTLTMIRPSCSLEVSRASMSGRQTSIPIAYDGSEPLTNNMKRLVSMPFGIVQSWSPVEWLCTVRIKIMET